jgi:23S rRNA (cytidine1920-2'-O)/16S rRNA (cytidine1409-2'-O)-methyltransferase
MAATERLDIEVHRRGFAPSREKARAMIMAGEVLVNGNVADKPGMRVPVASEITVKAKPRFASRGGEKLDAALEAFPVPVESAICADVGASTGGFTDCLLQRGAAKVYAIDVGYGHLDLGLRNDARVVVMERVNARHLETLPEPIALVVMDASFISVKLLLPAALKWMTETAHAVVLVKPQFEAGRHDVGKGGVVRDKKIHHRVIVEAANFAESIGLYARGVVRSPLTGPAGNVEFLLWLSRESPPDPLDLEAAIQHAVHAE